MSTLKPLSPLISVAELQQLQQETTGNLIVLDARFSLQDAKYGDQVYALSRIPLARRVDLDRDICAPITEKTGRHPLKSHDELVALMKRLGVNNDSHIVIYDDQNSMFAAHLWWIFKLFGHNDVQVLNGGITAWQRENSALETTESLLSNDEGDFFIQESEFTTVDANNILQYLTDSTNEYCIVDARAAARYRGEVEPLDAVAGHIPTAINHPFEQNLNEDGTFKNIAELKQIFEQLIEDHQGKAIVHQCGSGVSGCHNLFAMYYAGLGITKIYPGSWSEWCKDPTRPVA